MCGTILSYGPIKRTKKRHRCDGCGRIIPVGTMCEKMVVKDGGTVVTFYDCLDCREFEFNLLETPNGWHEVYSDDGCRPPFAYRGEPYAKFPILEPRSV